jgi:hypothetical protein
MARYRNRLPRRRYRARWGSDDIRDGALGVVLLTISVLASVAWIGFAYYHDCQHHRSNSHIAAVCQLLGW